MAVYWKFLEGMILNNVFIHSQCGSKKLKKKKLKNETNIVNMCALKSSQQYKELILDVFKTFIEICAQHNLRYFCCGGTAIGAIRHQGMIPWDDDIDVLMPRPDYERFIAISTQMSMEKYEIVTAEIEDTYYLPFAKLCNKHTSLVEYVDIPSVFGAYIDIFPLDSTAPSGVERGKLLQKFRRAANKLLVIPKASTDNLRSGLKHLLNFRLRTAFNEFFYAFNKRNARKNILNEIEMILQYYPFDSSEFVGNYGGMWGIKEFGPKEWFDDFVVSEFEGFQVRIPKGYHALLTQMYGDYMQLPPKDKRVTHHHTTYLNLSERKDIKDIKLIIGK